MSDSGSFTLRGLDLKWHRLEAGDLAEYAAAIGPLEDDVAKRSVRGRAYLLFLSFRRDQPELTFAEVLAWGAGFIASPAVSRLLQKVAPELGIETPALPPSMFAKGATRPVGRRFFHSEGNPIEQRG